LKAALVGLMGLACPLDEQGLPMKKLNQQYFQNLRV